MFKKFVLLDPAQDWIALLVTQRDVNTFSRKGANSETSFYSHDALEADSEQTELLKNEINFLNVSVKELEEDVFKLKRANDMKASELEQADSKYFAMIEEVKELRKINQCLLEDMNLVNEK